MVVGQKTNSIAFIKKLGQQIYANYGLMLRKYLSKYIYIIYFAKYKNLKPQIFVYLVSMCSFTPTQFASA